MGKGDTGQDNKVRSESRHVLVMGAGVIGVTTAYMLARAGFNVTVLDRHDAAGRGTSAENGAQLSYGFADPISSPATLRRVPAIIMGRDPGIHVRARHLLSQPVWALKFLRNCLGARSAQNTVALTRLALHSRTVMRQLRLDTQVDFDYAQAGRLVVYQQRASLESAKKSVARRNAQGCSLEVLSREACLELEPALENWQEPFAGGVYSAMDEVGDAGKFCRALASFCAESLGVSFRYGLEAQSILIRRGEAIGVKCSSGEKIHSDIVVNCLGARANRLAGEAGRVAPVMPLKGYSLTIGANENSPALSIASAEHRVVFARIGDRVRIAGLAHVRGHNLDLDSSFVQEMRETASAIFPGAGDHGDLRSSWCGLRPLTPDGLPSVGKTKIKNLYVNAGHGGLGWTLAAGSADLLLRAVAGGEPQALSRATEFSGFDAGDGPSVMTT